MYGRIALGARARIESGIVAAVALGVAWALKDFYRRAGFDELRWVLAPTVRLVEWSTGSAFELEAHHGYLSRALRFEVVPACAGVNFLIAAFLSLSLGLLGCCQSSPARAALLPASAGAAYAATVLANATRLTIAVRLHEARCALGWLTPERLHCVAGVAVYFLFLSSLFALAARMSGARRVPAP